MEIESMVIPAMNDFASLYIEQKEPVKGFFHYDITENNVFEKRSRDVMSREFDREGITRCIEEYMNNFPQSDRTKESLEKLKNPSSTVVIGGQQAGLLTGPLYSIHKIISIIKLAEQQEKKLGKPVVPVFWIAGEDHDYLEINHVYAEAGETMKKISFSGNPDEKRMTSDISFDKEQMRKWANSVFEHFGEREHTKVTLASIHHAILECDSITDFFSFTVMSLFKDFGLLIIDSADESLRYLEKPFFTQLIDQCSRIADTVINQQEEIRSHGFNRVIEMNNNAANLFYYFENERILLEYDAEKGLFEGKKGTLQFKKEELLQLLEFHPDRFSNNVVTRPIMQEWMFPTLAFIAGPGEIAYWGELKQAFELLDERMPPIIPRLNMTFLDVAVERDALELNLSIQDILKHGITTDKVAFLESVTDQGLSSMLETTKIYLEEQYGSIIKRLAESDRGLLPVAEKNLAYHLGQIDFLVRKSNRSVEIKHQTVLDKYHRIERQLRPQGSPQERVWNIFYFLNEKGESFIHDLMMLYFEFDGTHKVIKI